MNRGAIRDLARVLLSEPTASYWSDSELNNYINYGLEDFCNQTEVLEGIYTDSQVQYQADYSWPTNCIKIKQIEVIKGNSVYLMEPEDLQEHYTGIVKTTSSPPGAANVFADKIRLRGRPSVAAASTTLNGDITAAATSIVLTDASSFPRAGRIKIESETIEYWNKSSNTLSPCTRGMEGSAAATHSSGVTTTLKDIWIYCIQRNGDISSDSTSPSIATQFQPALAHYAAWLGRQKSKDYDLATVQKQIYDDYVAKATDYSKRRWKRPWRPK